mgnify:CR=1 FL=1
MVYRRAIRNALLFFAGWAGGWAGAAYCFSGSSVQFLQRCVEGVVGGLAGAITMALLHNRFRSRK